MKINSVKLRQVGVFRDELLIDGFSAGLNVVHASNESGKSTMQRAVTRALFDRYGTGGEVIKVLQPIGTDLAPEVAVDFDAAGERWLLEKRFLNKPSSLLSRWENGAFAKIADADSADEKVREILQTTASARGASKPEHWGLFGFLWARQGEMSEWPNLDGDLGSRMRKGMAQIEIDPLMNALRDGFTATVDKNFTATGRPRKGGVLFDAEEDIGRLEKQLDELISRRDAAESNALKCSALESEIPNLEKELLEQEAKREDLRELIAKSGVAIEKLKAAEQAVISAEEKDKEIHEQIGKAKELKAILAALAKNALSKQAALDETMAKEKSRLAAAAKLTDDEKFLEKDAEALSKAERVAKGWVSYLRSSLEIAEWKRREAAAEKVESEISELEKKLAVLPEVSAKGLDALEKIVDELTRLNAAVEAQGVRFELLAEEDVSVIVEDDSVEVAKGETFERSAARELKLRVAGVGEIRVRSGSEEVARLEKERTELDRRRMAAFEQWRVKSVAEARAAFHERKLLVESLDSARKRLNEIVGQNDEWRTSLAAAELRLDAMKDGLNGAEGPQGIELAEQAVADAEAATRANAERLKALAKQRRAGAEELEKLRAERQKFLAIEADEKVERLSAERALAELSKSLGEDDGKALAVESSRSLTKAQTALSDVKETLPADIERLPGRLERASAAARSLGEELAAKRRQAGEFTGALGDSGGLHGKIRKVESDLATCRDIAEREERRSRAAMLVRHLVSSRQSAQASRVVGPVEDELSESFAEVTGVAGRRVFLDETLSVTGIGSRRDEAIGFSELSQGAKEQLLLCLRIAVAKHLAKHEPQTVFLDDV